MDAKILTLGDQAITVEFGNDISIETNSKVSALYEALQQAPVDGIVELVPTYRSLTIHYRPEVIRYHALVEVCKKRLAAATLPQAAAAGAAGRILEIPVLYGGEIGVDLADVAAYHHLTPQQIIDAHTGHLHRIYMIGFWPGMPYMDAPNGLTIPRRSSPRVNVCQGAVIIQTTQTNILPNNTPTGWHIIGHTPVKPFDLARREPSLFRAGDSVRFLSVDQAAYDSIKQQVDAGSYEVRITQEG